MRLPGTLLIWLMLPISCLAAEEPLVIPLWPDGAPGSEGKTDPEAVAEQGKNGVHDRRVSRIHNPSITVYLPPRDKATGAAVVICPGGAHRMLAIDHEGYEVAQWLNSIGVAGIVLKYRLAQTPRAGYKVDVHALADARRAIRLVRSRAADWGIDPKRVGLMGFSAGGELTALAGTRFEPESSGATDPVDRPSSRPDFLVLVYPGGRPESFAVTKETPPTFLLVAADDRISADRTVATFSALRKAGVPAELHIYARGGHGFGMHDTHNYVKTWTARLQDWMADRGLLNKSGPQSQ
jgi:acetyl esterase/lipase